MAGAECSLDRRTRLAVLIVLFVFIALAGLRFIADLEDPDGLPSADEHKTRVNGHAQIRTQSASLTAKTVLPQTASARPRTRTGVHAKEVRGPTLASLRAAWIAGADAGSPDIVLNFLEASLLAHPARSAEAQLARRALDDLLDLRERRLRGGGSDPRDEAYDRESEKRQNDERLAEYAHSLRYGGRAETINEALGALGVAREAAVVDAILDAGLLPERSQRERRILLLWRMAADGVSTHAEARIRDQLEQAVWSSDQGESSSAYQALADLDRLEADSGE